MQVDYNYQGSGAGGAISYTTQRGSTDGNWGSDTCARDDFYASRVVPISNEIRPVNVAVNFIIKY